MTQDQVEAMTLADRMIVMNGGVADQIGKPLEVYANPATEFVAGFIGSPSTNFFDGSLLGEHSARIGVRPEHVMIAEDGALEATVGYAEALGAETLVHMRANGGALITVRQDAALPIPAEGEVRRLAWATEHVMRFDTKGMRC